MNIPNMKILLSLIIALFTGHVAFSQINIDGTYTGLEKICWRKSKTGECLNSLKSNPQRKWYHENMLKIQGDSAFLDQNPISIYEKDTAYSASDGAFYYYKGIVTKTDTTIVVNLSLLFCDYCSEMIEIQSDGSSKKVMQTKTLFGNITEKGIVFGNFLYKKTTSEYKFVSENFHVRY
jgi:hypothetical protein